MDRKSKYERESERIGARYHLSALGKKNALRLVPGRCTDPRTAMFLGTCPRGSILSFGKIARSRY